MPGKIQFLKVLLKIPAKNSFVNSNHLLAIIAQVSSGLTQAALDRGYAPWVSDAIFSNLPQAKPRQGQTRPGK